MKIKMLVAIFFLALSSPSYGAKWSCCRKFSEATKKLEKGVRNAGKDINDWMIHVKQSLVGTGSKGERYVPHSYVGFRKGKNCYQKDDIVIPIFGFLGLSLGPGSVCKGLARIQGSYGVCRPSLNDAMMNNYEGIHWRRISYPEYCRKRYQHKSSKPGNMYSRGRLVDTCNLEYSITSRLGAKFYECWDTRPILDQIEIEIEERNKAQKFRLKQRYDTVRDQILSVLESGESISSLEILRREIASKTLEAEELEKRASDLKETYELLNTATTNLKAYREELIHLTNIFVLDFNKNREAYLKALVSEVKGMNKLRGLLADLTEGLNQSSLQLMNLDGLKEDINIFKSEFFDAICKEKDSNIYLGKMRSIKMQLELMALEYEYNVDNLEFPPDFYNIKEQVERDLEAFKNDISSLSFLYRKEYSDWAKIPVECKNLGEKEREIAILMSLRDLEGEISDQGDLLDKAASLYHRASKMVSSFENAEEFNSLLRAHNKKVIEAQVDGRPRLAESLIDEFSSFKKDLQIAILTGEIIESFADVLLENINRMEEKARSLQTSSEYAYYLDVRAQNIILLADQFGRQVSEKYESHYKDRTFAAIERVAFGIGGFEVRLPKIEDFNDVYSISDQLDSAELILETSKKSLAGGN